MLKHISPQWEPKYFLIPRLVQSLAISARWARCLNAAWQWLREVSQGEANANMLGVWSWITPITISINLNLGQRWKDVSSSTCSLHRSWSRQWPADGDRETLVSDLDAGRCRRCGITSSLGVLASIYITISVLFKSLFLHKASTFHFGL